MYVVVYVVMRVRMYVVMYVVTHVVMRVANNVRFRGWSAVFFSLRLPKERFVFIFH